MLKILALVTPGRKSNTWSSVSSAGLKVYDTCHDKMSVYKQALTSAVDLDCSDHYELGVLAPLFYEDILRPLESKNVLPIGTYQEQNFTTPLIDILVHFLATRFESVDLFLSSGPFVLERFTDVSALEGICVKSHTKTANPENDTVVVAIGEYDDLRKWLRSETEYLRRTWIVLPSDDSQIDGKFPGETRFYVWKYVNFT